MICGAFGTGPEGAPLCPFKTLSYRRYSLAAAFLVACSIVRRQREMICNSGSTFFGCGFSFLMQQVSPALRGGELACLRLICLTRRSMPVTCPGGGRAGHGHRGSIRADEENASDRGAVFDALKRIRRGSDRLAWAEMDADRDWCLFMRLLYENLTDFGCVACKQLKNNVVYKLFDNRMRLVS